MIPRLARSRSPLRGLRPSSGGAHDLEPSRPTSSRRRHVRPPWIREAARRRGGGAGGHFEAVGTDAEIRRMAGPRTRVIDLAGGSATPGLVDGHCTSRAGQGARGAQPARAAQPEEAAAKVAEAARARPAASGSRGAAGIRTSGRRRSFPATPLDAAAPAHRGAAAHRRPRAVGQRGRDARRRVTRASQPPPERQHRARPGRRADRVFIDAAMSVIEDRIPPASARRGIPASTSRPPRAPRWLPGLTGVQRDRVSRTRDKTSRISQLSRRGKLPLRVDAMLAASRRPSPTRERASRTATPTGRAVQLAGVKMYPTGRSARRARRCFEPTPTNRGTAGGW
jgi:predicted amidohydrolase YtcJ